MRITSADIYIYDNDYIERVILLILKEDKPI